MMFIQPAEWFQHEYLISLSHLVHLLPHSNDSFKQLCFHLCSFQLSVFLCGLLKHQNTIIICSSNFCKWTCDDTAHKHQEPNGTKTNPCAPVFGPSSLQHHHCYLPQVGPPQLHLSLFTCVKLVCCGAEIDVDSAVFVFSLANSESIFFTFFYLTSIHNLPLFPHSPPLSVRLFCPFVFSSHAGPSYHLSLSHTWLFSSCSYFSTMSHQPVCPPQLPFFLHLIIVVPPHLLPVPHSSPGLSTDSMHTKSMIRIGTSMKVGMMTQIFEGFLQTCIYSERNDYKT